MVYIYFDVWFPILVVFFILILILILLRVRRARRLRMGNSTVITAGVGKSLNNSRGMIDGPISDSGYRSRQLGCQNLIISASCPRRHLNRAPETIALIYKSLIIPVNRRGKGYIVLVRSM